MYFSGGHFYFCASMGMVWHTEGTPHARQPPPKIHPQKRQNPPQERLQKICRESLQKTKATSQKSGKRGRFFPAKQPPDHLLKKHLFANGKRGTGKIPIRRIKQTPHTIPTKTPQQTATKPHPKHPQSQPVHSAKRTKNSKAPSAFFAPTISRTRSQPQNQNRRKKLCVDVVVNGSVSL